MTQTHDYAPEIQTALDAIREFGAPSAIIRGGAVRFPCKGLIASYTAIERQTSTIQYTDRKILVAAADLAADLSFEPDAETDQIEVTNPKTLVTKTYRIVTSTPLAPGGVNILFEIQARL